MRTSNSLLTNSPAFCVLLTATVYCDSLSNASKTNPEKWQKNTINEIILNYDLPNDPLPMILRGSKSVYELYYGAARRLLEIEFCLFPPLLWFELFIFDFLSILLVFYLGLFLVLIMCDVWKFIGLF